MWTIAIVVAKPHLNIAIVVTSQRPTLYDIVDASETVFVDSSRGSYRFGLNAGKQCVAMSLTAIVCNQIRNVTTWDSFYMNIILLNGDSLYSILTNLVSKDLLLLTDIPEAVSVDDKIYNLQYSKSFTGDVFMTSNDEPFSTVTKYFHILN